MADLAFKHSGTLGDLIYALPIVKHFGGGKFFLHMNQIDYLSQYYYNASLADNHFHKGRMNAKDFAFMHSFITAQTYITDFEPMDPCTSEITHNLDNFRPIFIQHPGNYVNVYCLANRILDTDVIEQLRNSAWLTVPSPKIVEGRDIIINRTARWLPLTLSPIWKEWEEQGVPDRAVFVGLPAEHAEFNKALGWNIPHQPTTTLLEVAEYIAGAKVFIGNQSVALSVAIGLGHPDIWCEARRDLPIERNECYFEQHPGIHYF